MFRHVRMCKLQLKRLYLRQKAKGELKVKENDDLLAFSILVSRLGFNKLKNKSDQYKIDFERNSEVQSESSQIKIKLAKLLKFQTSHWPFTASAR